MMFSKDFCKIKSLGRIKPDKFITLGKPDVCTWMMNLNKKQHHMKTIGPPSEYLSLLMIKDCPEDLAKTLSAGDGFNHPFLEIQQEI